MPRQELKRYRVEAPDGRIITVEGPHGASPDEVIRQAQRLYQPEQATLFPSGPLEEATGGPVERFLKGGLRTLDPRPLFQAFRERPAGEVLETIGRGIVGGGAGDPSRPQSALLPTLPRKVSEIPVLGPTLESILSSAREGNVAGAAGEAAGTFLPFLNRPVSRVRPTRPGLPEALPKTLGQRTQRPALLGMEEILRGVPGAAGVFRRFQGQVDNAAVRAADQIVESVRRGGGQLDEIDVGAVFSKAIRDSEDQLLAPAKEIYRSLDNELGTQTTTKTVSRFDPDPEIRYPRKIEEQVAVRTSAVMPETASLKEFAKPLLERIKDESKLINPRDLSPTREVLETVMNSPRRLPFQAFQDVRSDLLRAARAFDDPLPGKKAGIVRVLASKTDEAMEDALVKAGREDLLEQLRTANGIWKMTAETLGERAIKRLMDADPEAVSRILTRTPREELKTLRSIVPDETFDNAAAIVLRDEIFGPPQGQLSETLLGRFGVEDAAQLGQQKLGPARIAGRLERMKGRLTELVGPDAAKDSVELVTELFNIRTQSQAGEQAFRLVASGQIIGAAAGVITGVLTGNLALAAGGVAVAGGLSGIANVAAKALVRQPGSRSALRSMVHAMGSGNISKAVFWSQRFNSMVEGEERSGSAQAMMQRLRTGAGLTP